MNYIKCKTFLQYVSIYMLAAHRHSLRISICFNIYQYIEIYFNIFQYISIYSNIFQYISIYFNIFQYISIYCHYYQRIALSKGLILRPVSKKPRKRSYNLNS